MKRQDLIDLQQAWKAEIGVLLADTALSYNAIALQMGCTSQTVYNIARSLSLRRLADARLLTSITFDQQREAKS